MLTLMIITNDTEVAAAAEAAGVERIFVDWEILGKVERQGHLDTVISRHTLDDAKKLRKILRSAELLIRINPLNSGTEIEVEDAVEAGADYIMLPMFKTLQELELAIKYIDGRAKFIPLLETPESIEISEKIAALSGVHEMYIGLNDLHISLGHKFIFEPIIEGIVENVSRDAKKYNKRFGFGGVARVGEGVIPGEDVLSEHIRLNSSSVILSRTFYRKEDCQEDPSIIFEREVNKLRFTEKELHQLSENAIANAHDKFVEKVNNFISRR